jgi:uncharacterized membrane protein YgcG
MSKFIYYLLFLLSLCSVHCAVYSPTDIPNPNTNPAQCGRPNVAKSSICDPDNLLTKDSKDVIEGYINQVTKAEIGVLVVDKISPIYMGFSSTERSTETFAHTVHDRWGIGSKASNNGILLFLSVKDRSVFISTGKGVMKELTAPVVDLLIDHMKPSLKSRDYGKAFEKAVVEIKIILDGKRIPGYVASDSLVESDGGVYVGFLIFFAMLGGVLYCSHLDRRKKDTLRNGQKALDKLMKEMADCKENNTFSTPSCPICLEDFPEETDPQDKPSSPPINVDQEAPANTAAPSPAPAGPKRLSPKRPMSLQCGHVFCYDCLSTHLKSQNGTTCPICRSPVNPDDPTRPSARPQTQTYQRPPHDMSDNTDCSANRTTGGGTDTFSTNDLRSRSAPTGTAWTARSSEFVYRLSRMQRLYPTVMTNEVHASMSSAIDTGNIETIRLLATRRVAEVDRIISDMTRRAQAQSSGSSGSRSSFGGGYSSGGRGGRF